MAGRGYARCATNIREGLSKSGFVDGRNAAIELRFARAGLQQLPELAADLVRLKVDLSWLPAITRLAWLSKPLIHCPLSLLATTFLAQGLFLLSLGPAGT